MPGGSDPACSGGRSDVLRSPFAASSRSRPTTRCSRRAPSSRLPRAPQLTPNRGEKVAKLFVVASAFMPDHSNMAERMLINHASASFFRSSLGWPAIMGSSLFRNHIRDQTAPVQSSNSIISSCCGAISERFAAAPPKRRPPKLFFPCPSRERRRGGAGAPHSDPGLPSASVSGRGFNLFKPLRCHFRAIARRKALGREARRSRRKCQESGILPLPHSRHRRGPMGRKRRQRIRFDGNRALGFLVRTMRTDIEQMHCPVKKLCL